MTTTIRSVRDLEEHRMAFDAAMRIFELSEAFPREETCSVEIEDRDELDKLEQAGEEFPG